MANRKKELDVVPQLFVRASDARLGPSGMDENCLVAAGRNILAKQMFESDYTMPADDDLIEIAEYKLVRVIRLRRTVPVFEVIEVS